jgi:putative flavoprotein involved in K+ transport
MDGAVERVETVVVGAGQAGLSVGYQLKRRGLPFVILDGNARVGDVWRNRWDSLRLFTPARFDGLAGAPFPASSHSFPTKDEMADYLEGYARGFELPVRSGVRVQKLSRPNGRFRLQTSAGALEADNVVVAMSSFQEPRVPECAAQLDPAVVQLHSSQYRSPAQLRPGTVLVVGAGNSGAEIAREIAPGRQVWLSGRDVGHVPFRIEGTLGRLLVPFLFRVVFHRVLTVSTPMGRKARRKLIDHGGALIRVKPGDLRAAGVERVARLRGVEQGHAVLEDGRTLQPDNVIWCTGFTPGFAWIDLPVHGAHEPLHESGVVPSQPGLFFVGLHFLHSLSSTMIHGAERDADRIAQAVARRTA